MEDLFVKILNIEQVANDINPFPIEILAGYSLQKHLVTQVIRENSNIPEK